jgi:transposase-like protein
VDDVREAGLDLLPGAGEVLTNCNCPDFAVPCKHSAAVCYLVADALDDDPFALLLLRGRRKDELLETLRSRRGGAASAAVAPRTPPPAGIPARAAFSAGGVVPMPVPPRPLNAPGVPVAVKVLDPPRSSGVDVRDLIALATDAARRAWELASGDADLDLTYEQDLARRAADALGTPELADLAHRAGISARQLTTWATAWRHGGRGGLAVATDAPHDVDPETLTDAMSALPGATVEANRVTAGKLQLRLGKDNLWYRFDNSFNDWTLTRPPSPDPRDLL